MLSWMSMSGSEMFKKLIKGNNGHPRKIEKFVGIFLQLTIHVCKVYRRKTLQQHRKCRVVMMGLIFFQLFPSSHLPQQNQQDYVMNHVGKGIHAE